MSSIPSWTGTSGTQKERFLPWGTLTEKLSLKNSDFKGKSELSARKFQLRKRRNEICVTIPSKEKSQLASASNERKSFVDPTEFSYGTRPLPRKSVE